MTEDSWNTMAKLLAVGDKKAYETVFREFFRPLVVSGRIPLRRWR